MMKVSDSAKKELKNAGWLISGKIIRMLLSLLVSVWSARYLGPGNFGLVSYGNTFTSFFMVFCTLGINSVIIKEFVDLPEETGKTLGTALVLRLGSSFLSVGLIIGIASVVNRNEPITIAVVALCSVSLLFHALDTFNYWFQYQYRAKVTAIAALIAYVATSAYRIVLLIQGKSVLWFAFALSVDYIVLGIVLIVAYKVSGGPRLGFSRQTAKSLLKKSYHYILSGMMVAIYGQTDKLMLKLMLDETEVGYYSVATTVCGMWVFVLGAIIDSVYPTILRLHKENRQAFLTKNRQLYAIVFYMSTLASLVFLVLGEWMVKLLYGEAYLPAVMPLKIVTWYTAFSYLGVARNAWIVCEGRQKYLKYIYFSAAVLNVFVNLLMIPRWGAAGAALASLLTQILTSIVLPFCIKGLRPNAKLMLQAIMFRGLKQDSNRIRGEET